MEQISGITVVELVAWIIAAAGGLYTVIKLIDLLISKRKKYPCDERMTMLTNDKIRLDKLDSFKTEQTKANAVILRSINALINHEITGNSIEKMKEVQAEISDFLISR